MDLRLIAATNKELEKMVQNNSFREDLFYRINVVPILIPPLRDRKEDIIPLICQNINRIKEKYGVNKYISPKALQALYYYNWLGNIRELQNIIERSFVLSKAEEIKLSDLPVKIRKYHKALEAAVKLPEQYNFGFPLKDIVALVEKEVIANTLKNSSNLKDAAKILDVDLSTLVRKKKRYNI